MEKQENTFRKRLADQFAIPANIVAGTPKLELTGFSRLLLEPFAGIVQFSQAEITLSVSFGTVTITGADLTIERMNQERIVVVGRIHNICLEDGTWTG